MPKGKWFCNHINFTVYTHSNQQRTYLSSMKMVPVYQSVQSDDDDDNDVEDDDDDDISEGGNSFSAGLKV